MNQNVYEALCNAVGEEQVLREEPMKFHTTFRTGGVADYFVKPSSVESVEQVMDICRKHKLPYYIVGYGSNLLVSDEGFRGVIVCMGNNLSGVEFCGAKVKAQAGVSLSYLAKQVSERGYTGFEFATGIPGALGGAVTMNAGAYGGEMSQVVKEAKILTMEGIVKTVSSEELKFGYRTSLVQQIGAIVLEVVLEFEPGNQEEINRRCDANKKARTEKQPLEYASAGSTFKRPEGYFAGKLIMDAGLRGARIGDAQISEKHCGFLINRGNASTAEIVALMKHVQNTVYEKYQVWLEPEVRVVGMHKNLFER